MPKREPKDSQRIAQTELVEKSKQAAPDAHLGAQTQTVDRQTVSRDRVTVTGDAVRKSKRDATTKKLESQEVAQGAKVQASALSKLGLKILPDAKTITEQTEQMRDQPRWAEMGSSPQDYVKGVTESERTLLNTKEYVFFGYYQRIRQRLEQAWGPMLKERINKIYRSGRRLASDMDHTTRVLVTLNSNGAVVRVQVLEESGTRDLDDAAIQAFNKAGPFPNPPRGILDSAGNVHIPWNFVLKS